MKGLKVIISGGGTGGHIFPAIAIANAIKARQINADILFVGAKGKMEMEKVPNAGYKIIGLWISGFQRRFVIKNFLFPLKVILGLIKAGILIRKFKPDVVIGVGGFASGLTLKIASFIGIPTIIQEQNSFPGMTNRLLSKSATKICVAYEGMERFFPRKKIVFTGNPIRQNIISVDSNKEEAFSLFHLNPNKKSVLVLGGSLGALTINQTIASMLPLFIKNDIQIIWQTGKNYFNFAKEEVLALNSNLFSVHSFITSMDLAYLVSDIIISRAGAITISELCVVAKPVILIPSPNVTDDHQTKNAKSLEIKNAAIMISDSEATSKLAELLFELIENNDLQQTLINNIKGLAITNAADKIAEIAVTIAKIKN